MQNISKKVGSCILVATLTLTNFNIPTVFAQENEQNSSETVESQTETQQNTDQTTEQTTDVTQESTTSTVTTENNNDEGPSNTTNVSDYITQDPTTLNKPTITEHTDVDEVLTESTIQSKEVETRLILTCTGVPENYHGASKIDHYDDIYILHYLTKDIADKAYESFVKEGYTVDKDTNIDAITEEEKPDETVKEDVTDTEITETIEDTSQDEIMTVEEKPVEEHKTIVAIIDTGISDVTNDEVFKDRIIEGTSVISDSYVDDNGHGTTMAKIIAEETAGNNINILPIKALDKDGKGTVLSIALAIKYAKEHGADVINLSLAGIGQSNILTNAINNCYNNGITVVTAAGNDGSDAMEYMPGNVDTSINVSATYQDEAGEIKISPYSNTGNNIDFAANGIYKIQIIKEEGTIDAAVYGTSIAASYVTAYVALLKQINSTVNDVVEPVSETDVYESLKASAQDLGEEGFDKEYGYGYLTKENLQFKKSDTEDEKKDTDLPEDCLDGKQFVIEAGKKSIFIDQNHWWGFNNDSDWNAGSFDNSNNGSPAQGLNAAMNWFHAYGYTELEVFVMGNIQTTDTVFIPCNMKLTMYGASIFSAGQKTWQRIGTGVGDAVLTGITSDKDNNSYGVISGDITTCELHTMNIWDNTSTQASFGDCPGAVSAPCIYAEDSSFYSYNHWWSVGLSNGTFIRCTFDNTWGAGNKGAIASWRNLTCRNCTFAGNANVSLSRAITYCGIRTEDTGDLRGQMIVDGCTINNYGGWNTAIGAAGDVSITNTTINTNTNDGDEDVAIIYGGGDIRTNGTQQACTISGCNINSAKVEGIRIDINDTRNGIANATISNNTIHGNGTAVQINAGTTTLAGNNIYSNQYGIVNKSTVHLNSGNTYSNAQIGILNYATLYMYNGAVYSNTQGVWGAGSSWTDIRGGEIYSNNNEGLVGQDTSTLVVRGGNIRNNKYRGIYMNGNILYLQGGNIYSNGISGVTAYRGTSHVYYEAGHSPNIYSNISYGIKTEGPATINISNGVIYNNNNADTNWATGCGIRNDGGTINISGGDIRDNGWGNVWNNSGTLNISGGTIREIANTYKIASYGVWNNGTSSITGGDFYGYTQKNGGSAAAIKNCGTMTINNANIALHNSYNGLETGGGTTNLYNAKIYSNTDGVTIGANSTMNIYNGSIYSNNRYGIINHGNTTYSGGSTGQNTSYDVYQNGTYKMSGSASAYTKGVYLASGKTIDITGALTCADGAIPVTIAVPDNTVGRLVATCSYNRSQAASDAMIKKFSLQTKTTRTVAPDGKTFRKAALRSGNGTNGSIGTIILSQEQYVTFDPNIKSSKIKCTIPDTEMFYWKENPYIPTGKISKAFVNGTELKSLSNVGWNTNNTGDYNTGEYHPNTGAFTLNTRYGEDVVLYGVWDTDMNILFDGNDQTEGDNFTIEHFSRKSILPTNRPPFTKTTIIQKYDESQKKDVDKEVPNSFQGWSFRKNTMYKDADCYKVGSSIRTDQILINEINNDKVIIDKNGNVTVTSYVVWDMYPVIYAPYKYFNIDEINNGILTVDELLRVATVKDKEDGDEDNTNKNDKIKLEIVDFDEKDVSSFTSLGDLGYCTVTYKATDGAGNISYDTTRVYVCANDIVKGDHESDNYFYNRHITEEFYKAGLKADKNTSSHDVGGFYENSVWYNNSEYQKALETAFTNLNNDTPIMTYTFGLDDIKASHAFVDQYGIGNITNKDGLKKWITEFKNNQKVYDENTEKYLTQKAKLRVSVYADK